MSLRLRGDTIARPGMLDFAVNVWPEQRPATLQGALQHALEDSTRYPDESDAITAIAGRHGRGRQNVLLTNGACEAFWLLAQSFRPKLGVIIHPAFTEPEAALRSVGTELIHVFRERECWRFDPDQVPEDADCLVLGNPNNPTGGLDSHETITGLARRGRILVVDESFIDFVPGETSSLAGRGNVPGLIVVRSLTKLWSLAGIRAGYVLASPEVIEALAGNRQPWSINSLGCAALAFCATDSETPRRVAADVASARNDLAKALGLLPNVRVWPSEANFLLLRVSNGPRLVEALRERNIAVRPAASFPGLDESYIRIAVRTRDDNAALVEALREVPA
jgi:histidinol-phosphate/aromatic aminotransferase/cobyric acid decarboxylase-like protein